MEVYIIAHTSGVYMYPATKKVYKTKNGVMKEFSKISQRGGREGLEILKAQWVQADFKEYEEFKEDMYNGMD